jgi:hypothetical protein
MSTRRDRDAAGRARNARARDDLGRPLDQRDPSPAQDEDALPPDNALARAQQLLDTGQPFAAHEVLEAVWKATPQPERELWRGLAQLAVGITHVMRGNATGATALLRRAADSLAPYDAHAPHGIDAGQLRRWAITAADDLSLASTPPQLRRT